MILFSSMFLYEYSTEMIAKAVELAGCDGVEFWIETPHFWVDRDIKKLRYFSDFEIALHAPVLDLNPVSVNKSISDLSLKETLYTISLCKKINGSLVTIHSGKRTALREPVLADYESLHKYLRISSSFSKIKRVRLSLENSEKRINSLCKTAEELRKFVEIYDLKITYDIKHSNYDDSFYDLLNRICNVHVSGDGGGKHVRASNSEKVTAILKELSELGYDGILTIELDDLGIGSLDFRKKVEILREETLFLRKIFSR
ncbi:MAG: sugar phosphate isomerase/epimerase [Archaeoglobaceae archaeon]|nr:sugar phosphate isomerase/epimerase [Archaeoglobaceae archaeon]MDW7989284.1 sugar phosphate isomerase/epimerase [Archaeoglobaceae archaeon]